MDEMTLRKTVADNLIYYRRRQGLTQVALAQTINYSDKSVSKWERAEGMPDVTVLMTLAELYGITLNDLVKERSQADESDEKDEENEENAAEGFSAEEEGASEAPAPASSVHSHSHSHSLRTRVLVPVLSVGLVWLVAMVCFFFAKVISPEFDAGELIFLYGIPASCIVATVFACLWWNHILRFVFVSGIIWSVAVCLFATFRVPYIGLIFAVAGVLQALTVLWFIQIKK